MTITKFIALFAILLSIVAIVLLADAYLSMSSFKLSSLESAPKSTGIYEKPFAAVDGTVLLFPDFDFFLQGKVRPSLLERFDRWWVGKNGAIGNLSRFSDTYGFQIISKEGTKVTSTKLTQVPWGWTSFEVNGQTYTITIKDDTFIVWKGDIKYQREKEKSMR